MERKTDDRKKTANRRTWRDRRLIQKGVVGRDSRAAAETETPAILTSPRINRHISLSHTGGLTALKGQPAQDSGRAEGVTHDGGSVVIQ